MKHQHQQGVVMLEALIGIFIFSIGILALIGMQAVAVKNTIEAQYRTEAGFLANEIIGRIWVSNASPANFATSGASPCSDTTCAAWVTKVQSMMPGSGTAELLSPTIAVSGNQVTITVYWAPTGAPQYCTDLAKSSCTAIPSVSNTVPSNYHKHEVVAQIVGASG